MLYRLLITGLISGIVAGAVATIFHFFMVQPLILEAEKYEIPSSVVTKSEKPSHTHTHEPQLTGNGIMRGTFTFIANLIVGIAFGILLATGLTLYGRPIGWVEGIGWGTAGFLAFSLLPALGLPPELPGSATAELFPRQVWWLSTAFASVIGIALVVFNSQYLWKAIGLTALIVPHVIGAPKPPPSAVGSVPPELAAHFVVNTLFFTAIMWVILGITSSYVMQRLDAKDKFSYQTET